jgi:hypothetical protein
MLAYHLLAAAARAALPFAGPFRPSPLDRAMAGAKLGIQQAADLNRIEAPITEQRFDTFTDVKDAAELKGTRCARDS